MTSLFKNRSTDHQPLAARMRPRTLDEYIGQDHIIGPGRLLRRAIEADQLSSLIFYGPPGTGKTTLARVIAGRTQAQFISMNAVLSGVKDIRDAIKKAEDRRDYHNLRSILFVDEVHRFNKSQQDALLPHVENGTVILIGATTENPYFEVNKALVSRSRVFQLQPLDDDALRRVALAAVTDTTRGYGRKDVRFAADALDHLVNVANGDARALLNAIELAVETTPPDAHDIIHIDLAVAEESIQRRAVLYDKEGDAHFDTISAFIKSIRGSDPDASLYWLARMVYAGEDPRYIFRRLLILAGEDIGLAEPNAINVVEANAAAFDRVGMPEGRYPLACATLYLANCPKSNSVMGFFDALAAVKDEREGEVPKPLKDGSRDAKSFGHGEGYMYPHAYRDHWVAQQYLPSTLQGRVFYQPSNQGYEASIQTRVARRREEQIAATLAQPDEGDVLTWSPEERGVQRWMQRTHSSVGGRLGALRDRIFAIARPARHDRILDVRAGSGLLTWEALRSVPEGGVWSVVFDAKRAHTLEAQARALPQLIRPQVSTVDALTTFAPGDVRFDHILGRQVLSASKTPEADAAHLCGLLAEGGKMILAESMPRDRQRLYALLEPAWLPSRTRDALAEAEESLYAEGALSREASEFAQMVQEASGRPVEIELETTPSELRISEALLTRWFADEPKSYATQLRDAGLDAEQVADVQRAFAVHLEGRVVPWSNTVSLVLFSE